MKTRLILLLIGLLTTGSLISQSLDEVLTKYYKTVGQEKYNSIKSVEIKGKSIAQGMETEFVIKQMRPDKFYLEVDIQGAKMKQAYDGATAWYIAPWTGSLDPVEMSGVQLKSMKQQADFDGMLVNYKDKGYETEFIGKEDLEGSPVYKIKQSNKDGDIFYHFIDTDNYVNLKTSSIVKMGESQVESETYYSNYKDQDGVLMPFSMETKMNGQTVSQMNIDTVKFDIDIDSALFKMPEKDTTKVENNK